MNESSLRGRWLNDRLFSAVSNSDALKRSNSVLLDDMPLSLRRACRACVFRKAWTAITVTMMQMIPSITTMAKITHESSLAEGDAVGPIVGQASGAIVPFPLTIGTC